MDIANKQKHNFEGIIFKELKINCKPRIELRSDLCKY